MHEIITLSIETPSIYNFAFDFLFLIFTFLFNKHEYSSDFPSEIKKYPTCDFLVLLPSSSKYLFARSTHFCAIYSSEIFVFLDIFHLYYML